MELVKLPKEYKCINVEIPANNKDFIQWSEGAGLVCKFCNSKPFYTYQNWKNHTKGKRHNQKIINSKIITENEEIILLKKEIKSKNEIICSYSNKLKSQELKIKNNQQFIKKIIKELESLKKDYIKLKQNHRNRKHNRQY